MPSRQGPDNDDLIREALRNRGVRYVWGGASRGGFDCSGLVCYVFRKQRGMQLPHSASAQARLGTPVHREDLQPGDLVFFSTYRPGISHVGIYIGDNRFIHAANRRSDVRTDRLSGYFGRRLKAARRISRAPTPAHAAGLERLPGGAEPGSAGRLEIVAGIDCKVGPRGSLPGGLLRTHSYRSTTAAASGRLGVLTLRLPRRGNGPGWASSARPPRPIPLLLVG